MPESPANPINVAVTYRVCQHWRAPMFRKLNADPMLNLTVLHGSSVPETKLINGEKLEGFDHIEHWTLKWRRSPWVCHPFIFFTLVRLRPDVILAEGGSNFFSNFFVLAYSILFRKPVVWWTLGELTGKKSNSLFRKLYRGLVVLQEKWSTIYLGYSSVALKYFEKMGYKKENCFRAVNCVDTNRIFQDISERGEQAEALRKKINPDGSKIILFVGALTRAKKIDRLLNAFHDLQPKNLDAKLIVVGDGTDRQRLEELANELNINSSTHFAGSVIEGVSDYFEIADLFVLPGLGGLAVSEALAHGLPVICSRGDGCEVDLVRNGITGYRIESDDDDEVRQFIADKIEEMFSDADQLAKMQTASRDVIINEHNVDTYIENIVDAVQYAVTKKRRLPEPQIQSFSQAETG